MIRENNAGKADRIGQLGYSSTFQAEAAGHAADGGGGSAGHRFSFKEGDGMAS